MEQDLVDKLQKSKFYRFFDGLWSLVLVNLVMILLSVCGLVVFGIFPAIFAATAYYNDVLEGNEGKMLPKMFAYFRQYFWIGNLLMLIVAPIGVILVYLMFGQEQNMFVYLLLFLWILAGLVLKWYLPAVTLLYPEFPLKKKILFSLVASCDRFKVTLLLLVVEVGWLYLVFLIPQLCMFVAFSLPVWFGIWRIKKSLRPETIFDPRKVEQDA